MAYVNLMIYKALFRKDNKMEEGLYYLQHVSEPKPTLVYGYKCADMDGEFVFGFNTYDGGGLVPLSDLTSGTKIIPVKVTFEP
jgi:hypothetical protein